MPDGRRAAVPDGRHIAVLLSSRLKSQEGTAIQMGGGGTAARIGGVPEYALDMLYRLGIPEHCRQVVWVGVS